MFTWGEKREYKVKADSLPKKQKYLKIGGVMAVTEYREPTKKDSLVGKATRLLTGMPYAKIKYTISLMENISKNQIPEEESQHCSREYAPNEQKKLLGNLKKKLLRARDDVSNGSVAPINRKEIRTQGRKISRKKYNS